MRLMLLLALLALTTTALAGCLRPDADDSRDDPTEPVGVPDGWWVNAVPSSITHPDHDHSNHSHHAGITTPNFLTLGWDPLVTDQHNETVTGMMCGGAATREDGRRLAAVHSISQDMAFMLADITDPEAPFLVGEFYMPNAVTWDADITVDGLHVVAGAYPVGLFGSDPTLPDLPVSGAAPLSMEASVEAPVQWKPQIMFRDACTGETRDVGPLNYFPYGPGVVLISVHEPEAPAFQDWRSQPVIGPHSVGSHFVGGDVIVTSSVTNLVHEGSYYSFFRILETPLGSVLEPYAQIRAPGLAAPDLNGHVDVWIHEHPVTDQVLAYLANWDALYVYDISVPQVPMELAVWRDGDERSIHTTYPFPELRDGKQYLVVGQEVTQRPDRPTGWMYILDVTDPAAPEEVGRWTLPVKPQWDHGGLQFSTHYARVLEDTLFVAVNHAGLWAVDVADPSEPLAYGVFVPERPSPSPWRGGDHAPHIGDVAVDPETGVITTWDGPGGIYQLRFDADMPAPRAPAWAGE